MRVLRADPGTQIAAAVEGWAYPTDRQTAVTMDLFDLEHAKAGVKKPTPYPRAWKTDKRNVDHHGGAPISAKAALLRLRPAG